MIFLCPILLLVSWTLPSVIPEAFDNTIDRPESSLLLSEVSVVAFSVKTIVNPEWSLSDLFVVTSSRFSTQKRKWTPWVKNQTSAVLMVLPLMVLLSMVVLPVKEIPCLLGLMALPCQRSTNRSFLIKFVGYQSYTISSTMKIPWKYRGPPSSLYFWDLDYFFRLHPLFIVSLDLHYIFYPSILAFINLKFNFSYYCFGLELALSYENTSS